MTIAELIESLCTTIEEMAGMIDHLSIRLLQSGTMTEGEWEEVERIRKRLSAIGISSKTED